MKMIIKMIKVFELKICFDRKVGRWNRKDPRIRIYKKKRNRKVLKEGVNLLSIWFIMFYAVTCIWQTSFK